MFTDLTYCAGCPGAVEVRGDVSALKWDGACADRAYADGACADKAYIDGACADGVYTDKAYIDRAYGCPLLGFPRELHFFVARIWCLISC